MMPRILVPLLAVASLATAAAEPVTVESGSKSPAAEFGAAEVRRALASRPARENQQFVVTTKLPAGVTALKYSAPQSYALRHKGSTWYGIGSVGSPGTELEFAL